MSERDAAILLRLRASQLCDICNIWHLCEMANLPHSAKKCLLDGTHVCRHADGRAPVPSEQFGEQTHIKQGKGAGGLKCISTNTGQVAVWVNSFIYDDGYNVLC